MLTMWRGPTVHPAPVVPERERDDRDRRRHHDPSAGGAVPNRRRDPHDPSSRKAELKAPSRG
jgi:hypothetical protein